MDTLTSENKMAHLQMIQGVIDRMASTSALYKGFSATIVAGISAISFTDINPWILLLAFAPVVCFFVMDVYYLRLEKKYRLLYEKVRLEKIPADFSLDARCDCKELNIVNGTWLQCLKSPSIWIFYVPVLAIGIAVVALKFSEVF